MSADMGMRPRRWGAQPGWRTAGVVLICRWSRPSARTVVARTGAALAAAALALLVGAPAAMADDPTPTPTGTIPNLGPATQGTTVCTVSNTYLNEVSGMVASATGIYAVDSYAADNPGRLEVWTIDRQTCAATYRSYGLAALDPRGLSLDADGKSLWVADIGLPEGSERTRVAMVKVDPSSSADAVAFRVGNPSGGQIIGAAAVMQADGTPIIIANANEKAILYKPDGPLKADVTDGYPTLQPVGTFTPVDTGTANPNGLIGRLLVTGAAMSPDHTRVVLRTESDAYEFTVGSDGDVVKAITEGTPVITPLPDEDIGQAITYSADGKTFLTMTASVNPVLRSYTPYAPPQPTPTSGAGISSSDSGHGGGLSYSDITNIEVATGFLGLAAVVAGIVGVVRSRQASDQEPRGQSSDGDGDEDEEDGYRLVRAPQPRHPDPNAPRDAASGAAGGDHTSSPNE